MKLTLFKKHPILALYLAAVALRVLLALNGGQLFLRDEVRYWRLPYLAYGLVALNPSETLDIFWATATPHFGYHIINAPVSLTYGFAAYLADVPMDFFWPPALTIALAPLTASHVLLVYALAVTAGAGKQEALTAAFFTFCATSLFYFSRHLVPYDPAMALILFGLWAGMQAPQARRTRLWRHAFATGLIVGLGFLTYFGYWLIAGLALVMHVLWKQSDIRGMMQRAVFSGLGFIAWPLALTGMTVVLGDQPFVLGMRGFSGSITQGQFAEGWRFIWEFLWHTEHWLLVLVVALVAVSFVLKPNRRLLLWGGVTVGLYAILALVSTGLELFVMYGRLARQLTPFLMLAAAAASTTILRSKRMRHALLMTAALAGFANLMQPFMITYPYQFAQRALTVSETFQRADTVTRLDWEYTFPDTINADAGYVLVNVSFFYPITGIGPLPSGRIIDEAAHPLEYIPYQYNGHERSSRQLLREQGLKMYLIVVDD